MSVSATTKHMASGRAVDLVKLDWTQVDFERDIAPALARLCRYDGAMQCAPYSVAQHCVIMADAALAETHNPAFAGACLLHDAHEAYLGDLTKPAQAFLVALGMPAEVIHAAKERLDKAIFRAAGLPVPSDAWVRPMGWTNSQRVSLEISFYDMRMLATERRHLLAPSETPWAIDALDIRPIRMKGAIKPWSVAKAEMEWLDRLAELCPNHHVAAPPQLRASAEHQKTGRTVA